jgi:hypothetical protein
MAAPRDTSRDAYAVLVEELRRAGRQARVSMAADMSDAIRELCVAGIRRRHPDFDDNDIEHALVELFLGAAAPTPKA